VPVSGQKRPLASMRSYAVGNIAYRCCLCPGQSSDYHMRHVQKRPFVKVAVRLELAFAAYPVVSPISRPSRAEFAATGEYKSE